MYSELDNLIALQTITFRSKRQKISVTKYLTKDRKDSFYKLHKQWADGSITLHHFFKLEEKWLGYALTIGAHGGEKAYHKCHVEIAASGELELWHN